MFKSYSSAKALFKDKQEQISPEIRVFQSMLKRSAPV
jgi:hypothetical protein